jgi:hypothetical protein
MPDILALIIVTLGFIAFLTTVAHWTVSAIRNN